MRGAELYNKEQGEEPFYSIFPPQWQYPDQVHRDRSAPSSDLMLLCRYVNVHIMLVLIIVDKWKHFQ
jgi:hypothetical protein